MSVASDQYALGEGLGGRSGPAYIYINDAWGAAGVRAASARCHGVTTAVPTEGFADLAIPPPGLVSDRQPASNIHCASDSDAIFSQHTTAPERHQCSL